MAIIFTKKIYFLPVFLLGNGGMILINSNASAAATIPCPGVDEVRTLFSLNADNPKLSKILQHGYMPSFHNATLPTSIAPGNPIELTDGFVSRPFRTLTAESCPAFVTERTAIICTRTSRSSSKPLNPWSYTALVREQLQLEMGVDHSLSLPGADSFYNPSYDSWEEEVFTFLQSEVDCGSPTFAKFLSSSHSCSVMTECQTFDPEFVNDFLLLPTNGTTYINNTDQDGLSEYRAFVEKWGHGSVGGFRFGTSDLRVVMSNPLGRTLYLGRGGGLGNVTAGETYTVDDCQDPAPVALAYEPWYVLMREDAFTERIDNRTSLEWEPVRQKFFQLFLSYLDATSQIFDNNFTQPQCPTSLTASPNTTASPMQPTTSPTGSPTSSPTPETTTQPTVASTPDNNPSGVTLRQMPFGVIAAVVIVVGSCLLG